MYLNETSENSKYFSVVTEKHERPKIHHDRVFFKYQSGKQLANMAAI